MVFHNTQWIVVGHKMEYHNLTERDLRSELPNKPNKPDSSDGA